MLGKVGDVAPRIELLQRIVGEGREAHVAVRNYFIVDVEPSGIPVPDIFVGRERWIHPLCTEHEGHAAAVDHLLLLLLLLHAVEE
jgi:hypothetical protein